MTGIILTGCDPVKKQPAGPQAINSSEMHPFFDFVKKQKPLDRDLLFCSNLTQEEINNTYRTMSGKALFERLYNDFEPLTDLMIKNKLFRDYVLVFSQDERDKKGDEILEKYTNNFEKKCIGALFDGTQIDNTILLYHQLISLANLYYIHGSPGDHNKELGNNGRFFNYFTNNKEFIDLIIGDITSLESFLENFIIAQKDDKLKSVGKLLDFYGYRFFSSKDDDMNKRIELYIKNKSVLNK